MDFSEILIKHEEEIKKAIKKEYPHGQTIYFHYDDKITQNEVKEALENSKDHGGFLNALKDNIDEEMWEARDDLKNELGSFVAKWINENTDFEIDPEIPYSDLNDEEVDAFDDFLWENLEYDIDFETLKKNTKIEEITISISPDEYAEDGYREMTKYQLFNYYGESKINPEDFTVEGLEEVKDELTDARRPDMINWLVQTQGYELSDLYEPEKIANSKFLESLRSELCDWVTELNGGLSVTAIGADFESLESALGEKNIIISPENKQYIGISGNGEGSSLEIKLEKELVIPRKWCHVDFYVNNPSDYSVQGTYGLVNSSPNVFRETDKKPFEPKPANIDKMMEIAKKIENKVKELDKVADEIEENPKVREVYIEAGLTPSLEAMVYGEEIEPVYVLAKELESKNKVENFSVLNQWSVAYVQKNNNTYFETGYPLKPENLKEICEISEKYGENFSVISERDGAKFEVSGKDVDMKPLKDDLKVLPQKFKDAVKGKLSENGKVYFENGKRAEQEKLNEGSKKTKGRM